MNKGSLVLIFFLVGKGILFSQIQFKDFTQELLPDTTSRTFIPVAICDMNGDQLDDLVQLNVGTTLIINYQNEATSANVAFNGDILIWEWSRLHICKTTV